MRALALNIVDAAARHPDALVQVLGDVRLSQSLLQPGFFEIEDLKSATASNFSAYKSITTALVSIQQKARLIPCNLFTKGGTCGQRSLCDLELQKADLIFCDPGTQLPPLRNGARRIPLDSYTPVSDVRQDVIERSFSSRDLDSRKIFEQRVLFILLSNVSSITLVDRYIDFSPTTKNGDSYRQTLDWLMNISNQASPNATTREVVIFEKPPPVVSRVQAMCDAKGFRLLNKRIPRGADEERFVHARYIITNRAIAQADPGLDILTADGSKLRPSLIFTVHDKLGHTSPAILRADYHSLADFVKRK